MKAKRFQNYFCKEIICLLCWRLEKKFQLVFVSVLETGLNSNSEFLFSNVIEYSERRKGPTSSIRAS